MDTDGNGNRRKEIGLGERGVSERGKSGAHEIWGWIGISLCAPGTPRVGSGWLLVFGSQKNVPL